MSKFSLLLMYNLDYERTAGTAVGGGHEEGLQAFCPCKLHKATRILYFSAMTKAEKFQRNSAHSAHFSAIRRNQRMSANSAQSVHPAHFPRNRDISSAIGTGKAWS